jgi:hypothetical protein
MNMPAADVDIVEGANLVKIDVGERSGDRERYKKSDRCKKKPAVRPIRNLFVKELTDARIVQHQERATSRNQHKEK